MFAANADLEDKSNLKILDLENQDQQSKVILKIKIMFISACSE